MPAAAGIFLYFFPIKPSGNSPAGKPENHPFNFSCFLSVSQLLAVNSHYNLIFFTAMKKTIIAALLLLSGYAYSQDTLWINRYYEPTPKELAKYFRIDRKDKNGTFLSTEYYRNGTKKAERFTAEKNSSLFNGPAKFYSQNGQLSLTANYIDGIIEGPVTSYLKDGSKLEVVFKDNMLYNGKITFEEDDNSFTLEAKDGQFLYSEVYPVKNPKLRQKNFYEGTQLVRQISHNKDGDLISDVTLTGYTIQNGLEAIYNYSPFFLSTVSKYADGKVTEVTAFYKNGAVKSHSVKDKTSQRYTIYYHPDGSQAGELTEQLDEYDYSSPQDGIQLHYFYDNQEEGKDQDIVETYSEYKDGALVKTKKYRPDGSLLKTDLYNDGGMIMTTDNYDRFGKISSSLSYDPDSSNPLDGTEIADNIIRIYKAGIIISETIYYSNQKPFKKFEGKTAVFFDKKGKNIGTLTYSDSYSPGNYDTPADGILYTMYNDVINDAYEYKGGTYAKSIVYNKTISDELRPEKVSFYKNERLSKDISYYKNGKIKSDITYGTYDPEMGIFYNEKGKKISEYDYVKQNGTLYTFFEGSDDIQSIQKYANGKLLYEKLYTVNFSATANSNKYQLISEIDYNKSGVFYQDGKPLYTTQYKDGAPYNGKVITTDGYYSYQIDNYANGIKQGEQLTLDASTKEPISKSIYENGMLAETTTYKNGIIATKAQYVDDLINGDYIFYNSKGEEISRVTYKDDLPFNGQAIIEESENSTSKTTYQNGQLTEQSTFSGNILISKKTLLDAAALSYQTTVYYDNGKLKMNYSEKDGMLHGKVTYFNPKGKKEYEADITDGKLSSGTVWVTTYFLNTSSKYLKMTKSKNNMHIIGIGESDKPNFEMNLTMINPEDTVFSEIENIYLYTLYPGEYDRQNTDEAAPPISIKD